MLILDANTTRLRTALFANIATEQLQCVSNWRDISADSTVFTPGQTRVLTNGTTQVDLVPAPSGTTKRIVDSITIFNTDTATAFVFVAVFDGTSYFALFRGSLSSGERVEYTDAGGFVVYNSSGASKTVSTGVANALSSGDTVGVLAADVVNSNAVANTIADVTGLSFPVVASTRYWFEFVIFYAAAVTTTGSRWSISGPATTELVYDSQFSLSATTQTLNAARTAYDLPAAANADSPGGTAFNLAIVTGFIRPSANGTVIARFASEISSSAITAKVGSFVRSRAL